ALNDPDYESERTFRVKAALPLRCFRRIGPFAPIPNKLAEFLDSKPERPCKFAAILTDRNALAAVVDSSRLAYFRSAAPWITAWVLWQAGWRDVSALVGASSEVLAFDGEPQQCCRY